MAEKIFTNVRLGLKIDTLENWKSSSLVLKKGEVAFATIAASEGTGLTEPVVMMKIGDGENTFSKLGFDFYAKASDVVAACKSEAALTTFINGVIKDAGIATNDALNTLAGRVTTAEGKITTLEGKMTAVEGKASANETAIAALGKLVGDEAVATQISNAIADLKLDKTYAAKSLETTVDTHVKDTDVHVTTANKTTWNAALQVADIKAGSANGTVAVRGTDIAITGLGSAAFTNANAYDAAGSAAAAQAAAEATAKAYADGLAGNYDAKGSAATAESNAKAYADGLASNYDASGSAAQALTDAKAYTDDEITEWVGDKTVGVQITEAITGLDLANTYDAKGAASAAETAAKAHATGLNTAMNTRVEALEAIDHDHSNKAVLDGITAEKVAAWDAAEGNAKAHATALDTAMDKRVDALEAKFGEGEGNVESQIEAAVAAEKTLRENADADLLRQIQSNDADILALQGLVGDKKVSEAIAAETKLRDDADKELAADIKAITDDYLKGADKTELTNAIATAKQEAITTVLGEGVDKDFDTLKEVADWILSDTTGAAALQTDVAAIKADYLKAADKTALEGKITTAQSAAAAAQGEVDALEGVVATKAAQDDLDALAGRVTTVEDDLNTATTGLKARVTQAEADIDALEGKVGDKKVSVAINEAIEALKIGDYAKAADLTAAINQHNTDKAALEAEIAKKANSADLAAIAKSGNVNDLVQTAGDVIIFNCGGAE